MASKGNMTLLIGTPLPPSLPPPFQRYNPQTDEWATVASLPIPRSGFGSAVMDNILYLCGGCNNLSKVSQVVRHMTTDQLTYPYTR